MFIHKIQTSLFHFPPSFPLKKHDLKEAQNQIEKLKFGLLRIYGNYIFFKKG